MSEIEKRHIAPAFEGWRLCGHCAGHGTCNTSQNSSSCFVCAKLAGVPDPQAMNFGLPCSICNGHGCGAPSEVKINRLVGATVTVLLCVLVFAVIFVSFNKPDNFDQVLTFAGTILGSITGFYFGGRARPPGGNA